MIRKHVELSDENVGWFTDKYGKDASYSWILNLLFDEFRMAHTHTPADYAKIGAQAIKGQLEDVVRE